MSSECLGYDHEDNRYYNVEYQIVEINQKITAIATFEVRYDEETDEPDEVILDELESISNLIEID